MTAMSKDEIAAMPVEFRLNGNTVVARNGETFIQAEEIKREKAAVLSGMYEIEADKEASFGSK